MTAHPLFKLAPVLLLSLMLIGCESKPKLKNISISMNTWPGYEPILLAKENAFIGDNVNINRMDSATDVISTFHSGITDIAFVTLDEVLTLLDRVDYGVKIIAVLDVSHGGDVILSQKEIKALKDLKGKKIGVESTAIGAYLMLRAFDLDPDIDLSDIEIVSMLYSEHEQAFKNHHVSAVATFEPVKTALLKLDANILFDSTKIPGEIIDVMIVKDTTIAAKEDEIKDVLRGWFESIKFLEQNHKKAITMMAKYEGVSYAEFDTSHKGIVVPTLEDNQRYLSQGDSKFITNISRLQDFLLANDMKHKKENVPEILTDRLLPK